MRYCRSPLLSLLVAVSLLLPALPVIAADHADSPNDAFDRATDIADVSPSWIRWIPLRSS